MHRAAARTVHDALTEVAVTAGAADVTLVARSPSRGAAPAVTARAIGSSPRPCPLVHHDGYPAQIAYELHLRGILPGLPR